ncbi:beta strand repeat-containing protein [Nostoc sp.]|uniref:beta strand repeat-containing protein n=1 Tax=Nostoc sp. TaxID=1180 RepID=UPI002FF49971
MANINGTNGNDTLYGTTSNDLINGLAGDDKLYGNRSYDILNGDAGDDYLNVDYSSGNTTLNGGTGDDTLNAEDSSGNNLLFGGDGNDTLSTSNLNGTFGNNTLNGGNGNDTFYSSYSSIAGGGGKDKFVYTIGSKDTYGAITITDFGGIGKGSNPSLAVIAEADTLQFTGSEQFTAKNLQLTQNGNDLEITFEGVPSSKVVLQNFALENLDNLAQVGNILFNGQTTIKDSFDVFNSNSTQSTIFNKNTVTFLNDLSNNVNGFDNSDDVINGQGGDDIIDGKSGNDLLRGGAGNDTLIGGDGNDTLIGGAGNDTLDTGAGNNTLNGGAGDDFLNIKDLIGDYGFGFDASDPKANNLLFGGDGNDTLFAYNIYGNNTLNGGNGNDTFYSGAYNITYSGADSLNKILTGGSGKDKFVFQRDAFDSGTITITDFDGIGKGSNPSAAVIAQADSLQFRRTDIDDTLIVRNLQLTQNGNNTEITFENALAFKVVLQNFALENLDNLAQVSNIVFDGQTSTTDSFDVFDTNSSQSTIFNKNTVTFLNDLSNNVNGFDNSDDVINGQAGDDILDGKSGNDLLRGGAGNDTLIGGFGDDVLSDNSYLTGDNLLSGGDGNDSLDTSPTLFGLGPNGYDFYGYVSGNNTLNGGAGDDTLSAGLSTGDNLLSGGDGNDSLDTTGFYDFEFGVFGTSGNNTLDGGAGNDILNVNYASGNNLLKGEDGNDYLSASRKNYIQGYAPSGNNTLDGGAGNDTLNVDSAISDNLLSGGDGNDSFYVSSGNSGSSNFVTQTVDGGIGDDFLSANYGGSGGIKTTFNATTNIGSITAGTNRVSYKNIERLSISGTSSNDNIVGNDGNDTLSGGEGGNDTIDGGIGYDLLTVRFGNPDGGITTTFNATTNIGSITAGTNRVSYKNIERLSISGTYLDDNIVGNDGNDTLSGGDSGNDTINGGIGEDLLTVRFGDSGGGINSTFNAITNIGSITAGTNRVSYKNIERLSISGTYLDDNIVGSNGNDFLIGGNGNDSLVGGAGIDTFAFNSYYEAVDSIYDFNATNEFIQVSAGNFGGGLSIGTLETSQFTIGTSATTIAQRFIYNSATGGLFFDQDGSASGFTQVKFAQLSAGLSLTENNFVVIES